MSQLIGYAPLYADGDSQFIDSEGILDAEEVGALSPRRAGRRFERLGAKADRVLARQARYAPAAAPIPSMPSYSPEEAYQAAIAAGMVTENQFDGLGNTTIANGATGTLSNTTTRNMWIKGFVVETTSAAGAVQYGVVVTSITIAGLPVNIGSSGMPTQAFQSTATRFGLQLGRRLALVGQSVAMNFSNAGSAAALVTAGSIGDELNPYVQGQWMQFQLLQAAASGFRGGF